MRPGRNREAVNGLSTAGAGRCMKSLLRMLETRHGHSAIHLMLQLAPRCSQVPVLTIASDFSELITGGDVPTQRVAAVCLGRLVMDQDHEDTIALRNQPVQGKKYESEDGQAARHDRGGAGSVARARATAVDCRRLERSAAAGRLTAPLWQAAGRKERRRCAEQAQTSLWGTGDRLAITDGAISMSADDQSGRIRRQQQARTRFRPLDIGFGQSL